MSSPFATLIAHTFKNFELEAGGTCSNIFPRPQQMLTHEKIMHDPYIATTFVMSKATFKSMVEGRDNTAALEQTQ